MPDFAYLWDDPVGFEAAVRASSPAVLVVAGWLERLGMTVVVAEEWRAEGLDPGDILADGKRVEVKWRKVRLRRDGSWPFPTVMIGAVKLVDRMDPPMFATVTVDHDLSVGLVAFGATRPLWTVDGSGGEPSWAMPVEACWRVSLVRPTGDTQLTLSGPNRP